MGKDAPSTMPRHLHLVRDPRTHNRVARRMANESRARIQPITDPKGRSHLAFIIIIIIIIIITSTSDLQPSTAIANQSLGKSVSAN